MNAALRVEATEAKAEAAAALQEPSRAKCSEMPSLLFQEAQANAERQKEVAKELEARTEDGGAAYRGFNHV